MLAVLAHVTLRIVTSGMVAAGGAALVAVVFVAQPSPQYAEWIVPIRRHIPALAIGFTFLLSAMIADCCFALPARARAERFR